MKVKIKLKLYVSSGLRTIYGNLPLFCFLLIYFFLIQEIKREQIDQKLQEKLKKDHEELVEKMKREEQERKEKIAREKREAEEKRINDLVEIVIFIYRL